MTDNVPVLDALFPHGYDVTQTDHILRGTARLDTGDIAILGTTGAIALSARIALTLAESIFEVVDYHPQQPILFLVDTIGQALLRSEEVIGLNRFLAHLAQCIDMARRAGHRTISLVYGEAVSGGYLSFGMMTDRAYALSEAQLRVMDLRAMARVTKIPETRFRELAASSPIFAPGAVNYLELGSVHEIWSDAVQSLDALFSNWKSEFGQDLRSELGAVRGGRTEAQVVIDAVSEAT